MHGPWFRRATYIGYALTAWNSCLFCRCDWMQKVGWEHHLSSKPNMQISTFGTWLQNYVSHRNGHWMMHCLSLRKIGGIWRPCSNLGPSWPSLHLLQATHHSKVAKQPNHQGRGGNPPRELANLRSVGSQSYGKGPKRRPYVCDFKPENVPTRIAGMNMHAATLVQTVRHAGQRTLPSSTTRLHTDFCSRVHQYHLPIWRLLSLNSAMILPLNTNRRTSLWGFHQRILRQTCRQIRPHHM